MSFDAVTPDHVDDGKRSVKISLGVQKGGVVAKMCDKLSLRGLKRPSCYPYRRALLIVRIINQQDQQERVSNMI